MKIEWKYSGENPLRVFEAFAGYGSQAMALRNIGVPYRVVGISEIDPYAIKAYMAVHGETKNYGDISKVNWGEVEDFDLFTYSFPCTDISNAGALAGFDEGSGTRSSLLWECRKAIEAKKPKYLLLENVKNLVSGTFLPGYLKWCDWLSGLGYTNFAQVLDAKDYGVPQHRERVFVVSILGDAWFTFPQPVELKTRVLDVLEEEVDEKYYLDQERVDKFIADLPEESLRKLGDGKRIGLLNPEPDGMCRTIKSQYQRNSLANFVRGGGYGASAVIERYEEDESSIRSVEDAG